MAITEIHAITTTPNLALEYTLADKIVALTDDYKINEDVPHEIFEDDRTGMRYVRYFTITGYQDCSVLDPYAAFEERQEKWQNVRYQNGGTRTKDGREPVMYHLYQSFDKFEVSYEVANEIGRRLAEEVFHGYVVAVSTHGNTENVHNHLIISAWDENGRKWNDCHKTKRLIRSVSDRLCEEYGLSVLEHTRDMKLIKYTDKDGKTRYYEPTDRKNELIRKREQGEISTDDVNSYRNTPTYEQIKKLTTTNREEIQKDIDLLLPSCRSFEELLQRLRDMGYIIKDKKKNGDWLAHISYQAPTHEKATRESSLGDGSYYCRENLTRLIEDVQSRNQGEYRNHGDNGEQRTVPFFETYDYPDVELDRVDDDYKCLRVNDGFEVLPRSDAERKVITDIRATDREIRGLIDTSGIYQIIAMQKKNESRRQKAYHRREEELIAQIQSSFRCLQYAEKNNIYSYNQILSLYAASKSKYDTTIDAFTRVEEALSELNDLLSVPEKLSALQQKIEANKGDVKYLLEEYSTDQKRVSTYKALMAKYKISTPDGQEKLEQKVAEFENRQSVNREYMAKVIAQMGELENCIRTFDRIDSENGRRNVLAMEEFERMIREPEDSGQKRKGRDER